MVLGIEKGIEKGVLKVAKSLIGIISDEMIAEKTGLTLEAVKNLKN